MQALRGHLKTRQLKKWRNEALKQIAEKVKEEVTTHGEYIRQALKAGELAKRIVEVSEIEFRPHIEAIGGEVNIHYGNRELVHHLAKKLHVTFRKDFRPHAGTVTYTAEVGEATLNIYDIKDVPRCTITKTTKIEEVTRYEIACNGFYREPQKQN